MRSKIFIIMSWCLILGLGQTHAVLAVVNESEGDNQGEQIETMLADVNITDVVYTEVDGTVKGSFNLSNQLGSQTGITAGLLALNEKNEVVDSWSILGPVTLERGETINQEFLYVFPQHLDGRVSFHLMAYTDSGLPLSAQPFLQKKFFAGSGQLSCVVSESKEQIACRSLKPDTLVVNYYTGSVFGRPIDTETLSTTGGVNNLVALTLPTEPGKYTAEVRLTGTGEVRHFPLRVAGEFGRIENVVLESDGTHIKGTVSFYASPARGVSVRATLRGEDGAICGSATGVGEGLSSIFSVTPTCDSGTVLVDLINEVGNSLTTEELTFSLATINLRDDEEEITSLTETTGSDSSSPIRNLVLVIGGLLIAYIIFRQLRKPTIKADTLSVGFLLLTGASLLVPVTAVEAVTVSASAYGSNGEISYSVITTVSPDKSYYVFGDTITMNATTYVNTDAGASGVSLINANTAPNVDAGGPRWNSMTHDGGPVLTNPAPLTLPDLTEYGPDTGSYTATVPGLLGSNFLRMRMGFQTSITSPVVKEGNMTFSVYQPITAGTCEYGGGENFGDLCPGVCNGGYGTILDDNGSLILSQATRPDCADLVCNGMSIRYQHAGAVAALPVCAAPTNCSWPGGSVGYWSGSGSYSNSDSTNRPCTGTFGAVDLNHGQTSAVINDSVAGYTGSIQFKCDNGALNPVNLSCTADAAPSVQLNFR